MRLTGLKICDVLSLHSSYFGAGFDLSGASIGQTQGNENLMSNEKALYLNGISFGKCSDAPIFYDAQLPDVISWGNLRKWPVFHNPDKQSAARIINSYQYLKSILQNTHHYWQEKEFHRLELISRLPQEPVGRRLISRLFWLLSDYGLSVFRPLGILVTFFSVFALAYIYMVRTFTDMPYTIIDGFKLSAAAIFGPFGIGFVTFEKSEVTNLPSSVFFMLAFESAIGLVLIFLIGLAIRNQFKL